MNNIIKIGVIAIALSSSSMATMSLDSFETKLLIQEKPEQMAYSPFSGKIGPKPVGDDCDARSNASDCGM